MTERIKAAAVRRACSEPGQYIVYQLPAPKRHHHVLAIMPTIDRDDERDVQGFVTTGARFVDREEGMRIAKAAGQLIPRAGGYMKGEINSGSELFSEDMW